MSENVANAEALGQLADNSFVGEPPVFLPGAEIVFNGTGNVMYCESGVRLRGRVVFNGSNGLVALRESRHPYDIAVTVNNNCTFCSGRDNYFNGRLNVVVSEETMVFLGDDCLLSFGIWMRTADPHLVYDAKTKRRINPSRDIVVGDHVWIGQSAMVLKGSVIGSGAILGAMAVCAGKRVGSNESWAGNPARLVREGVFWDGSCVHTWTAEKTRAHQVLETGKHVFAADDETATISDALSRFRSIADAQERCRFFRENLCAGEKSNRFYVGGAHARLRSRSLDFSNLLKWAGK